MKELTNKEQIEVLENVLGELGPSTTLYTCNLVKDYSSRLFNKPLNNPVPSYTDRLDKYIKRNNISRAKYFCIGLNCIHHLSAKQLYNLRVRLIRNTIKELINKS